MLAFKTRLIFLRKSPEGVSIFIRLCWATTDSEMKRSGIELSEVFSDSLLSLLQKNSTTVLSKDLVLCAMIPPPSIRGGITMSDASRS